MKTSAPKLLLSIWKFPLDVTDYPTINMPIAAEILTVQVQHGIPCIWAIVDTGVKRVDRKFRIYGTGHPIDASEITDYVGTFQIRDGGLVFHVFDLGEQ